MSATLASDRGALVAEHRRARAAWECRAVEQILGEA